jgi:glycosyltransferase involved in cell wall biosynthesis
MHLFINSLAASAGGGLTYICNVIPYFAASPNLRVTVAHDASLRGKLAKSDNVGLIEVKAPVSRRFWFEQLMLPTIIRRSQADILLSTGNFALRNSPVPQILLSRNSLYTTRDFYRDLRLRGEYRMWLGTRLRAFLARRSIHWAQATVAPSEAFAGELQRWSGVRVRTIHHGFDRDAFQCDPTPLAAEVEEKLHAASGSLKLLFVSHYNYYRNFETLIRALPEVRDRCPGRCIKLFLTCKLSAGANPGSYRPEATARLIRDLGVADLVVELGAIPYSQLHHVYATADIYVTPAYAETFAHPLVEAMASGLPVVASDLPVHREICGASASYFSRFSSRELADRVVEIAQSPALARRLSASGLARSAEFSWKRHVDELIALARSLMMSGKN